MFFFFLKIYFLVIYKKQLHPKSKLLHTVSSEMSPLPYSFLLPLLTIFININILLLFTFTNRSKCTIYCVLCLWKPKAVYLTHLLALCCPHWQGYRSELPRLLFRKGAWPGCWERSEEMVFTSQCLEGCFSPRELPWPTPLTNWGRRYKAQNIGPGRSLVARFSSRALQQALPKVVIWFLVQNFPLCPVFSCIHRCWFPRHRYAHSAHWTPCQSDIPKQSCQIYQIKIQNALLNLNFR